MVQQQASTLDPPQGPRPCSLPGWGLVLYFSVFLKLPGLEMERGLGPPSQGH